MLEERDGADDLDAEDLFDELGDDVLVAFDVEGLLDRDVEALLDAEALLDVEALLDDEAPLLVRPDDVEGLVDARLEAVFPDPRPACDVEGRVPPLPAVAKSPLLMLLLTRLEVFLLFLL
jgi:hypothetical protein